MKDLPRKTAVFVEHLSNDGEVTIRTFEVDGEVYAVNATGGELRSITGRTNLVRPTNANPFL